jgi:hypothetical protein
MPHHHPGVLADPRRDSLQRGTAHLRIGHVPADLLQVEQHHPVRQAGEKRRTA